MYELRVVPRIADIPIGAWDALTAESGSPFVEWTWLHCLEETGCVGGPAGWIPRHFALYRGDDLVAAAPVYAKFHSEGEFVFDWSWADLASTLEIAYYPKWVVAVPFTPATGERILVRAGPDSAIVRRTFIAAIRDAFERSPMSSAHVLFPTADELDAWKHERFLHRMGIQFHWFNRGYVTFSDFLSTFSSKHRHQIRREMSQPSKDGVRIVTLRPEEITPKVIEAMYAFYSDTIAKFRWGRRYLTRDFFYAIAARFGPRLAWVVAYRGEDIVAGAFNIQKGKRLYGRYWGANIELPFLHFNVCFYHSIERCIRDGLEVFEPGAGGGHKLARGFVPTATHSAHWLRDDRLRSPVEQFLQRERAAVQTQIDAFLEQDRR